MVSEDDITRFIYSNLRETPILVKNMIYPGGQPLPTRNAYKKIEMYVNDFVTHRKKGTIERWLVLPGLRGTGKTTIVFQIYDYLTKDIGIPKDNILYLTASEVKNYLGIGIRDVINQFIRDVHRTTLVELDKKLFIIIDEAHFDPDWDETIKVLYDKTAGKENVFIIITGSSSIALEMGADSVRRKIKTDVFPMNFQEYLKLKLDFYPPGGTSNAIRTLIFDGPTTDNVKLIQTIENTLMKQFLNLPVLVDHELKDYIYCRGFPFGINLDASVLYKKVAELIDKIICDDLTIVYNYEADSKSDITKMLMFLALKPSGEVSQTKLSNNLGIPSARVNQTLMALEKTHLIFSIKPYEGAKGTVRDAWKYYFLSPTIKASLLHNYGRFDRLDKVMYGELVENAVISSFFRMMKTINKPTGIFYDSEKGGADFILTYGDKLIPVEVGSGKKEGKQVLKTARRHKQVEHKIIISNDEKIKIVDDIVFLPLKTFLFS